MKKISIELDQSTMEIFDEIIKAVEINIHKKMSVEELEKYKKYKFLATTYSDIAQKLADRWENLPAIVKQKIVSE